MSGGERGRWMKVLLFPMGFGRRGTTVTTCCNCGEDQVLATTLMILALHGFLPNFMDMSGGLIFSDI